MTEYMYIHELGTRIVVCALLAFRYTTYSILHDTREWTAAVPVEKREIKFRGHYYTATYAAVVVNQKLSPEIYLREFFLYL